ASDAANCVLFRVVLCVHDTDRRRLAELPGLPGCHFSALGTGVDLLDDTTQIRVYGVRVGERRRVVYLLGVVVHLNATLRTDHCIRVWHSSSSEYTRYSLGTVSRP